MSQASLPLKGTKCSIVVNAIGIIRENIILSHPITDTSPGTLYFSSCRASIMPKAIISFKPAIAVISGLSFKSSFVKL